MKKRFIGLAGLALASKLLVGEPMVTNNFIKTIGTTKSNFSLAMNDNKNNYNRLIYNDDKLSLVIDSVLEGLYTEIADELKKGGLDSFNEILAIIEEKPGFVFEHNVLNTTIRESGGSKELRPINFLIAENKYGDELYDISNKYTLYLLLNIILDSKDVDNFFLKDGRGKFYDLGEKTINIFNKIGITLPKNIEQYKNYSFLKNEKGIILCTYVDNKIIELGTIKNDERKIVTQKMVNIISFIQRNIGEVYSI